MIRKYALAASASLVLLAGCGGSGDIEINPSTVDNSVNNSNNTTTETGGGGDDNPCASYTTDGGQTRQGAYDGTNCTYSPSFVDAGNNLAVDLTIPDLPDGGAHIFQGSLFVGESFTSDADLAAAGISEGGDGPTLTVEAGATLAWQSNESFVVINRGAQIFAVGTAENPITFTSVSDINGDLDEPGTAGAEAVQQWGGMVIDGFGVTNACAYTGTRGEDDFAIDGECHVPSEGGSGLNENFYGGDNDDDSSGRLEFFVVKHSGAEVAPGNELNGITFSGVGRNTVVRNLQVYSTFDDGIEMFGGAVEFENFAAIYARDDSIDIDEGWIGTIDTALVIQSETDGNHCIEADGIGDFGDFIEDGEEDEIDDFIARGLNSAPTINNLTCIVSPNPAATGTHGEGAGWRLREGIEATINDSIVFGGFIDASDDNNYCFRPQDRGTSVTVSSTIIACEDLFRGDGEQVANDLGSARLQTVALSGATDPTPNDDTGFRLFEVGDDAEADTIPVFSLDFANMVVDEVDPTVDAPTDADFIGGLNNAANPFAGWTFGIFEGSRTQPFYFE